MSTFEEWLQSRDARDELEIREASMVSTARSFWQSRSRLRNEQDPDRRAVLINELKDATKANNSAQASYLECLRRVKSS